MVFETLTVECRSPEISKYWDGFHQVHLQFMQNDANNILDIIIVYFDISIDLNWNNNQMLTSPIYTQYNNNYFFERISYFYVFIVLLSKYKSFDVMIEKHFSPRYMYPVFFPNFISD